VSVGKSKTLYHVETKGIA